MAHLISAAVLAISCLIAPQDGAKPAAPAQQQPKPQHHEGDGHDHGKKDVEGEKVAEINIKTPAEWPNPGELRWLTSIDQYRAAGVEAGAGLGKYIRAAEERVRLDLDKVDYDADVVATVNGRPLTQNRFRLWLALTAAQNGVHRRIVEILTERGIAAIDEDGGDVSRFAVSDEDVAARLKEEEDLARSQGEEALTEYRNTVEQGLGWDRYRDYVKTTMRCEHYLLPRIIPGAPPSEQAGLPVEAAILLEDQREVRDWIMKSYEIGEPMAPIFQTHFLRLLQDKMVEQAEIRHGLVEDLPEGVFMTVDDEEVTLDEVLTYLPKQNLEVERQRALRVALLMEVVDQELAANDALLDEAAFAAAFDAHNKNFEGTLFPLKNIIAMNGFLSMDEYQQYYRRRVAYEKLVEKDDVDAVLKGHHMGPGKLFYENGKLLLDVYWVSLASVGADAGDPWQAAKTRIAGAKAALEAGKGADEVRRDFCSDDFPYGRDGKDKPRGRNEMRQLLAENPYRIFAQGYSLADDLFYNRKELELVGPIKLDQAAVPGLGLPEARGYVLVRVLDFGVSSTVKDFATQRPMIYTDYFDLKFVHLAWQLLGGAKLELTRKA